MKTLVKTRKELQAAGRWDIDFHLPAEGIMAFPRELFKRVDQVADIARDKRDPGREPESSFQYIDIAAVDVTTGTIANPQDMEGSEAPSRARKVVRAFDVIISTCRPTRGAIAVVPTRLHNQIASTAFSVLRPHEGVNPFYLHYALRLASTLEQFRKWSTGSSYPAILNSDVKKTLIPVPASTMQDQIASRIMSALHDRGKIIHSADLAWKGTLRGITATLSSEAVGDDGIPATPEVNFEEFLVEEIRGKLRELPPLTVDRNGETDEVDVDLLGILENVAA